MATHDSRHATAESWFLARGLPAPLTQRERARHLLPRIAPATAAYATVVVALLVVYFMTGSAEIYIDGTPTTSERVVLAVIGVAFPVAAVVGWSVHRLRDRRRKTVALGISVAVAVVAGVIQDGLSHVVGTVAIIVIISVFTASGVGAVLGWGIRLTTSQVAAMGDLFVRALPVVLLTVVVFFNAYVWVLSSTISRTRLWVALLFLVAVTAAFIVSASRSRVRPMLESIDAPDRSAHDLNGTPFDAMSDPEVAIPLTRTERFNVVFVLAAAQITHLFMVAFCTAAIFFTLGLIVLSPELLAKWTEGASGDGTVFGITIPVPQSLIHMSLILCALTFMYVSAGSVGDEEYRRDFLDPLIEDLHTTLIARNRFVGGRLRS